MGVNMFLLDRRTTILKIGGCRHVVGTLRRFYKITELDEVRFAELEAAANICPSPLAVMVMEVCHLPLADDPYTPAAAHVVLGWDEGLSNVTDVGWDFLPRLGYAVRDPDGCHTLFEERRGVLHAIGDERARELDLLDATGAFVRHGQPCIVTCRSVRAYIAGYAEADCVFDNGSESKVLVATEGGDPPPPEWLIGKRPMDVRRYQWLGSAEVRI